MARAFVSASSQYVTCGDINSMDGLTTLSFSMWFKRTSTSDQVIATKFGSASSRVHWQVFSDGNVYFAVSNGVSNNARFASNDTNWHHVIGCYDGGGASNADKCQVYFDGVAQSLTFTSVFPATGPTNASPFEIGRIATSATYSNGCIAHVKMWDKHFTAGQAKSVYSGYDPDPSGLLGYWPLGYGSPEPDLSGNGNNGTVTNGPAVADDSPTRAPFAMTEELPYVVSATSNNGGAMYHHLRNLGVYS